MGRFSLLRTPWIPVRLADGSVRSIAPSEITLHHDTNPVVAFAWPRPDFDLSNHEFLIGLLAASQSPHQFRGKQWVQQFHQPPTPDQLAARFDRFHHAFLLDGEGPCFLQDFDAIAGEILPVDALFIEAPGANTIKLNKDLFVKRGRSHVLSRATAAIALYTLQQFAPSGGAGHRTSLRGGGPLVTLALPDGGKDRPTLWQRLSLNTPADCEAGGADLERSFPWLAPTRTSAKKEPVHAEAAHKVQAFFGMPRRIRLVFSENAERSPCSLTGVVDEIVCTGFTMAPWGVNYGIWQHPLTPYYASRAGDEVLLPVHAPAGRLGYRQWLGLVYDGPSQNPASAIKSARKRLRDLGNPWRDGSRLLAGGYAMDNMKALAFTEAEMPLHTLDPEVAVIVEKIARLMIESAVIASRILGQALRRGIFGAKTEVRVDQTLLYAAVERFWEATEHHFHAELDKAADFSVDDPDGVRHDALAQHWRKVLRGAAYKIFDDTAPIDSFRVLEAEDVVEGRKSLAFAMEGYGKLGADFFKALGLTPPEIKSKKTKDSKRGRK